MMKLFTNIFTTLILSEQPDSLRKGALSLLKRNHTSEYDLSHKFQYLFKSILSDKYEYAHEKIVTNFSGIHSRRCDGLICESSSNEPLAVIEYKYFDKRGSKRKVISMAKSQLDRYCSLVHSPYGILLMNNHWPIVYKYEIKAGAVVGRRVFKMPSFDDVLEEVNNDKIALLSIRSELEKIDETDARRKIINDINVINNKALYITYRDINRIFL